MAIAELCSHRSMPHVTVAHTESPIGVHGQLLWGSTGPAPGTEGGVPRAKDRLCRQTAYAAVPCAAYTRTEERGGAACRVNDSKYGLQCGVFTHDWDKARALLSMQLIWLDYSSFAPHVVVSMS
jgi:hypothetical protein